MFLKSLTIRGFKSFAEPATLEFEPGINVVVGPNGSGKSNVVDAVAWVLGAQGPRTVRSGKMEDVIFAGTASRAALGRAEVSLTIDNESGRLAHDLAEVTITRTLFRSGESEYAINGQACRLLDVQEMLSDTGVGRQQHVIIGQGQLDSVLNARPEDRRAIIEEAAGILKYRRRRERAERRLASTEENLERLFDLVREVKRQIRPLERQAAAARSHGELADALRRLRLSIAGRDLRDLDERRDGASRERASLETSEVTLRETLARLESETARTTDELSARRESDLSSALGRVEGLVERARGLRGVLRERKRALEAALDAAADADVVANLEAEVAKATTEIAETEALLADQAPELTEATIAERRAGEELAAHRAAAGTGGPPREAADALGEARAAVDTLKRGIERDRHGALQAESRLGTVRRRLAALDAELEELSGKRDAGERARHELQSRVAQCEADQRGASEQAERASSALRQAEQELHRSEARADALARALEEARGAAGAELLAGVGGVLGTVLDLVEVEPGFEAAFEAALGNAVAAVVVSGSDVARRALDRLRGGDATGAVLALDAIGSATRGGAEEAGGGARPLRGQVRARSGAERSGEIERLLDRLLGDVVWREGSWSDSIDLALAHPELVVVTKDGDRFSATGWRIRAAGGVVTAALVDEATERAERARLDAQRCATEHEGAARRAEEAHAALAAARRADDRNESEREAVAATLGRVADDRQALGAELDEAELQFAELQARAERDAARLAEIEASLPELETAAALEREAATALQQEASRLADRLAEATARRVELSVSAAELEERKRVLTGRIGELERRLAGHVEERQRAAEHRTRLQRDLGVIDALAELVDRTRVDLEITLTAQRELHQRQIEAVRAGGARLEDLRAERAGAEHQLAAVRARIQKLELELTESSVRRESLVDHIHRELAATAEEALATEEPQVEQGVGPEDRAAALEAEIAKLGPVNPLALEELSGLNERHQFLESQVEDVRKARRELHGVIRTLDEEIMSVFDSAFNDVAQHFDDLVATLFPGGTGRLSLTDPERLLETGVEVEVRPAGRNVRRLSLLSGGERSLVALAFLFAVFRSRPSPFYLMDEVEAALDDVNLSRFLGLIGEFGDNAQLIIVSHQKRTMESADALYGVTMAPGGSSKVVSQKVAKTPLAPAVPAGEG